MAKQQDNQCCSLIRHITLGSTVVGHFCLKLTPFKLSLQYISRSCSVRVDTHVSSPIFHNSNVFLLLSVAAQAERPETDRTWSRLIIQITAAS